MQRARGSGETQAPKRTVLLLAVWSCTLMKVRAMSVCASSVGMDGQACSCIMRSAVDGAGFSDKLLGPGHLGWDEYRMRHAEAIEQHGCLVVVASSLLPLDGLSSSRTKAS
jgi:hypothetical protein